jgi:putative endonuclease
VSVPPQPPSPNPDGTAARRRREKGSRHAELAAALLLMVKGYRILARRYASQFGEIDIIAVRGPFIVFVEVKQRPTEHEAEAALTDGQGRRIRDAAELWVARHPRYREHDMRFDAVFVLPWRLPRHLPDHA